MKILRWIIPLTLFFNIVIGQNFGRFEVPEDEAQSEVEEPVRASRSVVALEEPIDPASYIIGPGDEIGLNILTSETLTFPLTVTPTGDLFIPAVGVCHVAGMTLEQAIGQVQTFINEKAYPNARSHMVLLNMRQFKLFVSGAVTKPGFVNVTPATRLDEVIEMSEGFHQLAKEFEIVITRSTGLKETVNYHRYLLEGKLDANPIFLEGDMVLIPFGKIIDNGIVVRGSVAGSGYDIISNNETLDQYIKRQIVFRNNADLRNVTIKRESGESYKLIVVSPDEFENTVILPGDAINFMWERGVMVNGFVKAPGGFTYYPGYSVADYISLSGGNLVNGNPEKTKVAFPDGRVEYGLEVIPEPGTIITVPRTFKDIFIGDSNLLTLIATVATLYLTFLATV